MNEWLDSTEANASTVRVWTPWGEQTVAQADRRALMRRASARLKRADEAVAAPCPFDAAFEGRA